MITELTIGVVFRNERHSLKRCLDSLKHIQKHLSSLEVVLVDNNSDDDSYLIAESWLQSSGISGQLIRRDCNHMAQARNDIIAKTRTRYLYFTDADCEVQPSTWPELIKEFRQDGSTAAWGGCMEFPPVNEVQMLLGEMQKSVFGHFGSAQMRSGHHTLVVSHLSTSHVLYDLEKVNLVGGFDDRLAEAAEDLELSLRIQAAGYKMAFIPKSKISHYQVGHLADWGCKALRNGLWQTRLIAYNPLILKTARPWPGLAFIVLFPLLLPIAFLYFTAMGIYVLTESGKLQFRVKVMGMYMLTHFLYLIGELYGLGLAIKDRIDPKVTKN